jgi:sec-independent protein translocase protein TatC
LSHDASTFWDHVQELRGRLIKSLIGVALGTGLAFWQWERLWAWIAHPITSQKLKVAFIATSPMETVMTSFKLSLIAGCLLSCPWVMWQVWCFVAPGLYVKERALFFGTFFSSLIMFALGAAFCYFTVLPAGLAFLANYMQGAVTQSWKQEDFAAFIIQFLLAFGLIFEMPVAAFVLGRLGMISPRSMWSFFRFAIVIIFIVAALLTPGPDPISQIMMAVPLCLLYLLSIGVCAFAQRKEAA